MKKHFPLPLVSLLALLTLGCGSGSDPINGEMPPHSPPPPSIKTVQYDAGPFTIEIPQGWQVETGGQCATLAFVVRDPGNPLNQFFFFSNVGPVYLSQQKKMFDQQYVNSGGYDIAWLDMPVVMPLTPDNFMKSWQYIVSSRIGRGFMRHLPTLTDFQPIDEQRASNSLMVPGSDYKLIRGLFQEKGRPGQGMFSLGTVPQTYAGLGFGVFVAGVITDHRSFQALIGPLSRCLDSFYLKESYAQDCRRMQAQQFEAMLQVGRTLSETSDIITRGWQNRSQTSDILSEKWSDTILGKERLYDPDSGEVYEFDQGFYDRYRLNTAQYNRPSLIPLPDGNAALWGKAPLNGNARVHIE